MSPARVIEECARSGSGSSRVVLHVLYDTPLMQSASAIVCDQLRASFGVDLDVHTVWSHFQHLADRHYSREAAEVAAQSDVVIVATTSKDSLPGPVARWLGSWICQQHKPDTAFCGLFLREPGQEFQLPPVAKLLEATARMIGREWLAGCVCKRVETEIKRPVSPAATGSNTSFFFAPDCHGING